ncbi:hypothetical protein MTR67_034390 [Solanum verrucosum]|uniref:Pectin acetylesterase n=1 Tax=Solanum verrucosum TaxID=315347 RepID=A0AAF0U7N7_SOLVR|nr:hypothetical protein MTR67_034390 [Solanum verrucosum]
MDKGFGEGTQSWMIHLSGGRWCRDVRECQNRSRTSFGCHVKLGSGVISLRNIWVHSNLEVTLPTMKLPIQSLQYCKTCRFVGTELWLNIVEEHSPEMLKELIDPVSIMSPFDIVHATNLHFRGARIFSAVMEDLFSKGLKDAKNVPTRIFIREKASNQSITRLSHYMYIMSFRVCQSTTKILDFKNETRIGTNCYWINFPFLWINVDIITENRRDTFSQCFFPQNMQQYIKTPLYTIMSPFDIVQVGTSLGDYYSAIKQNNCTANQKKNLRGYITN